jgi:hypothetical protein
MRFFRSLSENVAAGLRLALFLPVERSDFRIGLDQTIAIVSLVTALSIGLSFTLTDPPRVFESDFVSHAALIYLATIVAAYFVALLHRAPAQTLDLLTVMAAGSVWTTMGTLLGGAQIMERLATEFGWIGSTFSLVLVGWGILITLRSIHVTWRIGFGRAILGAGIVLGASFGAAAGFPPVSPWYTAKSSEWAPYSQVSVEDTYQAQRLLMSRARASLASQRPGVTDLYFIGFGGFAYQDVFMREVLSVQDLFDQRFDTERRSIALVNNIATLESLPVASVSNLEAALGMIGERMDPDEDVMFLYLTSHGSPDPFLAVEFWPLGLKQLTPNMLKGMLDRAGIKWRVVVVSACYSGGFIDPLKDDHTLILTAARADRTSFGCANENQYTEFGDAYFNHQLRHESSFIEAFARARAAIEDKERAEGRTPSSKPQIFVGQAIRAKLAQLEARLRDLQATSLLQ